jgi:hypothetical protein
LTDTDLLAAAATWERHTCLLGCGIEKSLKVWLAAQALLRMEGEQSAFVCPSRKAPRPNRANAPRMKQRPMPFETPAIEIKRSDARSLGPKAITKKS